MINLQQISLFSIFHFLVSIRHLFALLRFVIFTMSGCPSAVLLLRFHKDSYQTEGKEEKRRKKWSNESEKENQEQLKMLKRERENSVISSTRT